MRKKNSILLLFGILAFSGIFISSQDSSAPLSIQQLIDKEVNKRIEKYKSIRIKRCNEKIMEAAGAQADSIIIARAKALKVLQDTLPRPFAPDRPIRPELLKPIDSTFAAPILDTI